jgi:hypothetical protein
MRQPKLRLNLLALACLHAAATQTKFASDEVATKLIDPSPKDKKSENDDALVMKLVGNDERMKPIVTREMLAGTQPMLGKRKSRTDLGEEEHVVSIPDGDSNKRLAIPTPRQPAQFGAMHHVAGAHAAAFA